ncbi:ATP-binding protein [Pantoea sp. B9002]|uniref:ATP-binding protein n=1 Tax=Pantoea sp. B9002 TaxID=2726979 RepID=UPI0015A0FDD9|nr:ATP-binding protein [Pantoea sp. B9002]NWA62880.1 ATP-binding protein [Pantoea sp. B9002]
MESKKEFKLEFSNRVIEHLGIKLYQNKPTNVIAEFLSNSWDADAQKVNIDLKASTNERTPEVIITDNGRGMNRDELTDEFLIIGRNRRGNSPSIRTAGGRLPMGRKGIGKLAGFGIAQTVDVISSPNINSRNDTSVREIFWLRFNLDDLLAKANMSLNNIYEPEVLADGLSLESFNLLPEYAAREEQLSNLVANLKNNEGGVCVILSDTNLKKSLNTDMILKSMGRRFTVSMLHPDFKVFINNKEISPGDALPAMHDFGFGKWDSPLTESLIINGVKRELKYWVRFVDLQGAEWSIENAGIGIYTHGKIAQDRPFFFDVKGKEILSRYLYGVVEADWLDELPDDVVSTDRRSIDWDTSETQPLHEWGAAKLNSWLDAFRKWRATKPKTDTLRRIRSINISLSGPEEEALAELLSEVLDNLGDDEEAKDRATESFTNAWVHAPTRKITQDLWEKIFSSINSDTTVFTKLVDGLRKSMVPEAMGLAVTMAQRVAAITVMTKMIEDSRTETHLQRLIENFPWLLGPQWERLTANQSIRTLVEKAHKPNEDAGGWSLGKIEGSLKPDFVFLTDSGKEKEFIVFELKGPEVGKTLLPIEYKQLHDYIQIISEIYTGPDIKISGVLVGHDKGGFYEFDNRIQVRTWNEVLLEARNLHVAYLKSLLTASDPQANDIRLQQISDFGGIETMELLKRFGGIEEFPDVISKTLNLYGLTENSSPNPPLLDAPKD